MCSFGSLELIVNNWLDASFDAGDEVTHWVHACLGWIDLDNLFQLDLASLKFLLPVITLWLARLEQLRFRVLASVKFSLYVVRLGNRGRDSVVVD